jgi:hypothetical protein
MFFNETRRWLIRKDETSGTASPKPEEGIYARESGQNFRTMY